LKNEDIKAGTIQKYSPISKKENAVKKPTLYATPTIKTTKINAQIITLKNLKTGRLINSNTIPAIANTGMRYRTYNLSLIHISEPTRPY